MTDRGKIIEGLNDAIKRADYDGGIVRMSVEVCQIIIDVLEDRDWISVKDRLPNDYQPVIVSDGGEPEFAIFYAHYNGYGSTFVTPDCYEEEEIEGITHWMPLPEPPKEDE